MVKADSILVVIAELPWRALTIVAKVVVAIVRLPARIRRASRDVATCPAGHRNDLLGKWRCKCAFEYAGGAFMPCPHCRHEAVWIACETCGLSVRDAR